MEDLLSVKKVANLLGLHEMTIRALDKKGKLQSFRDCNGYRRFRLIDVLKLKEERDHVQ
jgi:excisionase family DNA binding protein